MKRGRPKGSYRPHPPTDRDFAMKRLSDEGKTLAYIGAIYGLTRERVRQLLTKHFGITKANCNRRKQIEIKRYCIIKDKRDKSSNKKELNCSKIYGCSIDAATQINGGDIPFSNSCGSGPARAYFCQRHNAGIRGIKWDISFPEWWSIWEESGKYHLRGRVKGEYAMARFGDTGSYSKDNVYICLASENSKDYYRYTPKEIIAGRIKIGRIRKRIQELQATA